MQQNAQRILLIGGCGYIGSKLGPYLQSKGHQVDVIDLELFGNRTDFSVRRMDYRDLTSDDIAAYDTVILLAGHSNVAMAVEDPDGAFANNLEGVYRLIQKIDGQKLIYASSSSVYTGVGGSAVDENWSTFHVHNMYDLTKFVGDKFAELSGINYWGLRFGTVNGSSPNLRTDLIVNRMVLTALTDGQVNVFNPSVNRPILGIMDICRAMDSIISNAGEPGLYNLASFNATVQEIGEAVAKRLDVPLEIGPDTPTYDFRIATHKFERAYGFSFSETLDTIIDGLLDQHRSEGLTMREKNPDALPGENGRWI